MSTGGAALLGVSVLELRTDQGPLNRGLTEAQVSADRAGLTMQRTMDRRMVSMGQSMGRLGSTMTRSLTLPIIGLGVATGDMAAKFQASMEMVHTQAGASQREVDNLRGKVLALARVTPQGPQALAQGLFHLESIGLRGAKAMDALKIAAQGAAVGGADLESVTTALGSAWLVNIKGAGNLRDVMGLLNATVGAGNMRMQDLVQALGTGILPAAKLAGLGIKDVMGALAVFSDEGWNSSSAAAQLATAMHFLYAPTSKASTALQSIGLGADSLATDMHKPEGLLTALTDLRDHLERLPGGAKGVQAEQVLSSIFPAGRGRVLETLLNQLNRYGYKLDQIGRNTKNFTQDVTATQQTASYKIHVAWSKIQADAVDFGDKVLPDLVNRAADIAGFVDKVAQDFTKLPKGLQDAIITGGIVLAGMGPAMTILSRFETLLGKSWTLAKKVEQIASAPLSRQGVSGLFGKKSVGALGQSVATMEVGTLIARMMVGGAGGGAFSVGRAAAGERAAAAEGVVATKSGILLPGRAAEGIAAEDEAAKAAEGAGLSLGKAAAAMAGVTIAAKGLYDAFSGSGGGLEGGIERFLKGTIGMVLPSSFFPKPGGPNPLDIALARAGAGGVGHLIGDSPAKDVQALGNLIAKIKEVQGNLSKLSPEALVELKAEAEKLAKDPALAKYRGTLNEVLAGLAHVADSAEGQGRNIAQGLEHGWNSVRFQSEPMMLQELEKRVKDLPPQMQAGAIQSVIAYAKGLQAKGKLPAGAWQTMLAQVNRLFPGWQKSMGLAAQIGAATFTKELDLTRAEHNVKDTLDKMKGDFPEVSQAMEKTKGDVIDKAAAVEKALRGIDVSGSAPMLAAVTRDTHRLRQAVSADLEKMVSVSRSSANDMRDAITNGSGIAARNAETNFGRVASAVGRAMNSGLLSSEQGSKLIGQALNAMLKAFGAKQIPIVGTPSQQLSWEKWFMQGSAGTSSGPGGHGASAPIGASGPGHRATGGMMVNHPTFIVGEEAPAHPEVVIASNPAYRKRNLELWQKAGQMLGVPGFAQGGIVTASTFGGSTGAYGLPHPGTIARLQSGGSYWWNKLAPLSHWELTGPSGRSVDTEVTDWGSGGAGIGGHPRAIDLWEPGTTGLLGLPTSWLGLINVGGGALPPGAGGMAPTIPTPKVTGSGTISRLVQGALNLMAKGANSYVSAHMPVLGLTSAPPIAGLPSGVGVFDGKPVDKWIIPILQWAAAHGWGGSVTSGYRTPAEQMAAATAYGLEHYGPAGPLGSNHVKTAYPGGAVDVTDPSGLAAVLANYPGHPNLIWGGPVMGDYVHFSATGHRRGGIIGALAAGGMLGSDPRSASMLSSRTGHSDPLMLSRFPRKRRRPPQHSQHGTVGGDGPAILPLSLASPRIQKAMALVNGLIGSDGQSGDVGRMKELYANADQWFQLRHPNLNYVVTQDQFGNPVTPYIDWELGPDGTPTPDINSPHAVNASLGELMELFAWQTRIVGDEQRAAGMLSPVGRWIGAAIAKRRTRVQRLKAQIRRNLEAIRAKQRRIAENLRKLARLQNNIASAQRTLQSGRVSPARSVRLHNDIAFWQGQSARLVVENIRLGGQGNKVGTGGEIGRLMTANRGLGGDPAAVGSAGQIGMLTKEIGQLDASQQTLISDRSMLMGLSGVGGDLETQKFNLATLRQQIGQLSPKLLQGQLTAAQGSSASTAGDSQLVSLVEQELTTAAQTIAVEKAEINVLGSPISLGTLPAFGGSFATGGVVPGMPGEPRTIIAHGGEKITPVGTEPDVRVRVEDHRVRVWVNDVERIVDSRLRTVSRNAGRGLPGAGGGLRIGR